MGERLPLDEYVQVTQGCGVGGWPAEYVSECEAVAREHLQSIGVAWGPKTDEDLREAEGHLAAEDAPDAIRAAASELEPAVRAATGTQAAYELSIETANVDAYWGYWLDGAGSRARLRRGCPAARRTW
jgi:hypothetical protein